jgi:hypothetical protein
MAEEKDTIPANLFVFALTIIVLMTITLLNMCSEGSERNHCYGNKTCDDGLQCRSNVCVK